MGGVCDKKNKYISRFPTRRVKRMDGKRVYYEHQSHVNSNNKVRREVVDAILMPVGPVGVSAETFRKGSQWDCAKRLRSKPWLGDVYEMDRNSCRSRFRESISASNGIRG